MNTAAKLIIAALSAVVLFGAGYIVRQQTSDHQLVYICPGDKNGQPHNCANLQEFEVFDANGAPIYSVGEYGGDAVFGDNSSVFPPGTVTHPSIVESYTTPGPPLPYGSPPLPSTAARTAPGS